VPRAPLGPPASCRPMLHHDHRERYKAPGACLVRACVLGLAERDRGNVAAAYTKCGHTCGPLRQGAPPRPPGVPPLPAALPLPRTQLFRPGGDRTGQRLHGRCQGWRSHPERSGGLGLDRKSPDSRYTCIPPGRAGFPGLARAEHSIAGAFPTGGRKQCLAAPHEAGATQRRTGLRIASRGPRRRCVDRSADCALTGVPCRVSTANSEP